MMLTRYHSQQAMSAQRIARACKTSESQGRYWLLLCGNEASAIAYGKRKLGLA